MPAENGILPSLTTAIPAIPFSEFIEDVQQGNVVAVKLTGTAIRGRLRSGGLFTSVMPAVDSGTTIQALLRNKVTVDVEDPIDLTRMIGLGLFPLTALLVVVAIM